MKRLLFLVSAVTVVILAAFAAETILEGDRKAAELEALRSILDQARVAADSCKRAIALEQEGFLRFARTVDSLRTVAESYEDPDQGGVPQADYHEYLGSFELYNNSVEAWQHRVDSLQANEARCRVLVEAHNQLSDSVRRRQEEMT